MNLSSNIEFAACRSSNVQVERLAREFKCHGWSHFDPHHDDGDNDDARPLAPSSGLFMLLVLSDNIGYDSLSLSGAFHAQTLEQIPLPGVDQVGWFAVEAGQWRLCCWPPSTSISFFDRMAGSVWQASLSSGVLCVCGRRMSGS